MKLLVWAVSRFHFLLPLLDQNEAAENFLLLGKSLK